MPTLTRWLAVVSLLLATSTADSAAAETTDQLVERLGNEAINAYKLNKYDKAVELLNRAYAIQPLAALLYNLAKAHDKLGDPVTAYETYRKYLATGDADPKLVPKAQARIEALEAAYRAKTVPKETPKEPKGPTEEDVSKAKAEGKAEAEKAAAERAAAEQEAQQRASAAGRNTRRAALVGAGVAVALVGLAGVGAGVGLWSTVASKQSAFGASSDETTKRNLRDSAAPLASASTAMYVVGGALAAVGVAVLVAGVASSPKKKHEGVTLAPWVAPTGAGTVATWRF